jgi:branched-chain amino acid transport system ATP-binding protein
MLQIMNITKKFGGVTALEDLTLSINEGESLGLIGPNGSGKTTLLNIINGIYKPDNGEIIFDKQVITGLPPYKVSLMGIARTFQVPRLFKNLTVYQNMLLPIIPRGNTHKKEASVYERALEILELLKLKGLKDEPARNLSGGQQKLLEFGRSLMGNAKLLLLDEPFAGVHPELVKVMINTIKKFNEELGVTFIIVTHELEFLEDVAKEVAVLNNGRLIARGKLEEVAENIEVINAYMGGVG